MVQIEQNVTRPSRGAFVWSAWGYCLVCDLFTLAEPPGVKELYTRHGRNRHAIHSLLALHHPLTGSIEK